MTYIDLCPCKQEDKTFSYQSFLPTHSDSGRLCVQASELAQQVSMQLVWPQSSLVIALVLVQQMVVLFVHFVQ